MSTSLQLDALIVSLYSKGYSGREIAEKLCCSLKKIYRVLETCRIKRRSGSEKNALSFAKQPPTYSLKTSLSVREKVLMNAALMLYLGEGAKTQTTVDFTNSNPDAVKIFTKFLREICNVDCSKLRVYLYCFSSQSSEQITQYWSRLLKIPVTQFTKPYISSSKSSRKILEHGVVHIRYNDKRLLEKILSLCEKLTHSILSPANKSY